MAVVLLALGSRGDVQPMSVLGGELVRRGIPASVIASHEYRDLVEERGARFVPVDISVAEVVANSRNRRLLLSTLAGQGLMLRNWVHRAREPFADAVASTVAPGDTVISGILAATAGMSAAEANGGRAATLLFTGQHPTAHRESHCFERWYRNSRRYNEWGAKVSWRGATSLGATLAAPIRRRLGLPRLGERGLTRRLDDHPILLAASPLLVPPAPDWPTHHVQTGHITDESGGPFPADLMDFLSTGPVFVGVGSFTGATGGEGLDILTETARRAGRPIITLAPAPDLVGRRSEHLYAVSGVNLEHLFPEVAGVVHHAGAGTAHAALRSGRPNVGVPFGVDQPYHADRLHRLGVGPPPVPFPKLDPARLAALIDELVASPRTAGYEQRAADVAERARAEDGLQRTVEALGRLGLL